MGTQEWTDLYVILTAVCSAYLLYSIYRSHDRPLFLIFLAAVITNSLSYIVHLTGLGTSELWFTWTSFLAIVFCICGLLVFIRNSKPVFARFPLFLTALPLLSILFFPLVMRSLVINDLINGIFQGGAIASAVILFSLDHFSSKFREYFFSGMLLITAAFIYFWFILGNITDYLPWLPAILANSGFLILTAGFYMRTKK